MDRNPDSSSPYGQLHSQAKAVIFNVNRYFLDEKDNGAPILPPSKVVARTAAATKTSENNFGNTLLFIARGREKSFRKYTNLYRKRERETG